MRYAMMTLVFGTLLAFAACAAASGAPDPQAAGDQTTDPAATPADGTSSARLAGALLASEPDDAVPASLVNKCVEECGGDEGCIACCHCTHPTQCCM